MKFADIFVPRWQHSNPDVRQKAVMRLKDLALLEKISEKDDHERVRLAAVKRIEEIRGVQVKVTT